VISVLLDARFRGSLVSRRRGARPWATPSRPSTAAGGGSPRRRSGSTTASTSSAPPCSRSPGTATGCGCTACPPTWTARRPRPACRSHGKARGSTTRCRARASYRDKWRRWW